MVSSIVTWRTGFPFTPVVGGCTSTPGGPSLCPVRPQGYTGPSSIDTSNDAFITGSNTAGCIVRDAAGNIDPNQNRCFSLVAPGLRLPGIGRNSFRGPRYFDVDMAVSKRFGLSHLLGEGRFFEVKANFFNVFNLLNLQPFNFNSPSTQVENALFGKAERGLAGRVIEIQGRFSF